MMLATQFPQTAQAETAEPNHTGNISISPEFGTTGAGAHVGVALGSRLAARFGTGYLTHLRRGRTSSLDYDMALKLQTVDVLLDWYPDRESSFRVTGGVAYNGSQINATARSNAAGDFTLDGNTYDAASAGTIEGRIDFRKLAPYLGLGWGMQPQRTSGWSFSADLGVLVQGAPNVALTSRGCTSPADVCSQLADDVKKERNALAAEVGRYKVYPVLRVGATYRF